jgi:hypothetical protein
MATEQVASDTERGSMLPRRARRTEANLTTQRACWEQAWPLGDQGRPCLIGQLWSRTEGKPVVRNLRGDDGNVGIIRSPIRAIVLPDHGADVGEHRPTHGAVSVDLILDADKVRSHPDLAPHSTMHWHWWVVLIAGSTTRILKPLRSFGVLIGCVLLEISLKPLLNICF